MTEPYCSFEVGMKVECIHSFGRNDTDNDTLPEVGSVYTIRAVEVHPGSGHAYILLREIINPVRPFVDGTAERIFNAAGFRRVIDTGPAVAALKQQVIDVMQREKVRS